VGTKTAINFWKYDSFIHLVGLFGWESGPSQSFCLRRASTMLKNADVPQCLEWDSNFYPTRRFWLPASWSQCTLPRKISWISWLHLLVSIRPVGLLCRIYIGLPKIVAKWLTLLIRKVLGSNLARRPAILTEVFVSLLIPSRQMPVQYLISGHDYYLSNPSFINHSIVQRRIVWVTDSVFK
jgi:hypothetical protein